MYRQYMYSYMYLAEPKPGTHAPKTISPGSLLKNGGGESLGTRLIFTKLLIKVVPVWNPVRQWRSVHYNRYITELEGLTEQSQICWQYCSKPHDCSKVTHGGDTCSHTCQLRVWPVVVGGAVSPPPSPAW